MTAALVDPLVMVLAGLFIKATVVVALAVVVHAATTRWLSAAGRHLVTVVATSMLLALPVLSFVLPPWAPPVPRAIASMLPGESPQFDQRTHTDAGAGRLNAGPDLGGPVATSHQAPLVASPLAVVPITRVPWSVVLLGVYLAGVCVMGVHLVVQRWRVHRLGRAARAVDDDAWRELLEEGARTLDVRRPVRLLRSHCSTMPMTFGTLRPAILLPATADTWKQDRRRAVVLHELAHVARFDCLAQWAACVMRAVYWCHPGAWWVASRLQVDREFACDDLVLAAGAPPREYAGHLLDIAYSFGGGRAPALAVRMARQSQLEGRLRALLDGARHRRRPSRPARLATTAGAFAVLLPLASVTQPAARPTEVERPSAINAERASAPRPAATPAPQQAATPAARASGADSGCTWDLGSGSADTLHLGMRHGRSNSGRNVTIQQLEGLSAAQLATGGAVRFVVRRDAGMFTFEGMARGGAAGGVCSFAPSATFGPELARRGISGLTPADQEQLARHDVGLALVDELRAQKYATPTVADLVKAGQHGVHLEYVRGMGALGYATGSLAPLITLRDHGVTPDYAKALASFGYATLPIEQLQRARDHGVTPDYIKGMRDAGHGTLTLDQLITTRDHGVTPDFGRALADAGYAGLSLDQLVRTRDHGVTPDYIRDMKAFGVSGPLDQLVRMRDHGVTPAYVKALQALGYTGLSVDELVRLRDHGMTADRIQQANAHAGGQQYGRGVARHELTAVGLAAHGSPTRPRATISGCRGGRTASECPHRSRNDRAGVVSSGATAWSADR